MSAPHLAELGIGIGTSERATLTGNVLEAGVLVFLA